MQDFLTTEPNIGIIWTVSNAVMAGLKSFFMTDNSSKNLAYRLYENFKKLGVGFVGVVQNKLRFQKTISAKARIVKKKDSKDDS